jgi:hypothetical protein
MPPDVLPRAAVLPLLEGLRRDASSQRARLADLRESVAALAERAATAQVPWRTLELLFGGLARVADVHEMTLAGLRALVADPASADSTATWLRRLHAEHEEEMALLALTEPTQETLAAPAPAAGALLELLEALSVWEAHQRILRLREQTQLVPSLLAMARDVGPDAPSSTLAVRRLDTLSTHGRRTQLDVFCPAERRSVGVEWCRGCPLVRHVGAERVECVPGVPARAPPGAAQRRLGDDAPVADAMAPHHLRVLPDVTAGAIADTLDRPPLATAVVDPGGRLLGIVATADVAQSPPDRIAQDLGRRGLVVPETASVAEAVDHMVHGHVRWLAVTDDEERVVGLLTDVDALRWIAQRR